MSTGPFDEYIALAKKHFHYLVEDYGFEFVDAVVANYECNVRYMNPDKFVVLVYYEHLCAPFVMLYLNYEDGKGKSRSLEFAARLLGTRSPPKQTKRDSHRELSPAELDKVLKGEAADLRQFGEDFLRGDRSRIPMIRERAKRHGDEAETDDWVEDALSLAGQKGATSEEIRKDVLVRLGGRRSLKKIEESLHRLQRWGTVRHEGDRWSLGDQKRI